MKILVNTRNNHFLLGLYRVRVEIHQAVVAHAFNLSTLEAEAGDLCELEASLVYRISFRTVWTVIQRNSVSENQRKKRNINTYSNKHVKAHS